MSNISEVKAFWERNLCLDKYLKSDYLTQDYFEEGRNLRYKYHYHIPREIGALAHLKPGAKVLEIGVGMGIDTQLLCEHGFKVTGIDLTQKSVDATTARLAFYGLSAQIEQGNAEGLQFPDDTFDVVYSFGVIHHTPDTQKAVSEIYRVLKKNGTAFIMLYHRRSLNYFAHKVMKKSFDGSRGDWCPEEKAYTKAEVRKLFSNFRNTQVKADYLFGTGWKWVNNFVPIFVKKPLGKTIGWHLLIWATK